jgi:Biotin-lipoyl like
MTIMKGGRGGPAAQISAGAQERMSIKEEEERGPAQPRSGPTQGLINIEEKSDSEFDEEWKQGEPWLKRRWKMLAGLLCLLVVAGGAYYWFFMRTSVAAAPFTAAKITRGNISVTVSSDGQVAPKQALDLSFPSAEKVTDVLVKPGDSVKSGQPLAKIDTTSLQNNLNTAQAGLKSAQAALDDLTKGSTASDIAAAQSAVNADLQKLSVMKQGPKPADVVAAQSNLESAKAKLQALQDGPTAANLSAAQAKTAQAQASLQQTQANQASQKQQALLAWQSPPMTSGPLRPATRQPIMIGPLPARLALILLPAGPSMPNRLPRIN